MNLTKEEITFIKERRKDNPLFDKLKKFAGKLLVWDSEIKFFEMYSYDNQDGNLHSKDTDPQYLNNKFINTRTKLKTETRLEIDKLPYEKAEEIIIKTAVNLQKEDYHFAIFKAEGGRSPHLIIYDLEQLEEMKPFKRTMAQLLFWQKYMPFGTANLMDKSILHDEHYVPLEFSNHWKHGTPFELILEYCPGGIEKCKH